MGWKAIEEYKKQAEQRQAEFEANKDKPKAFGIIIKSGESAEVTFLQDEPETLWTHTYQDAQGKWQTNACLRENCPFCAKGNKAKFRAYFTVVDHRERSYISKKTNELVTVKDQLRYLELSPANAEALMMICTKQKKQLLDVVVDISKTGAGKQTRTDFIILPREDYHEVPEDAAPFDFEEVFGISAATAVKEAVSASASKYD